MSNDRRVTTDPRISRRRRAVARSNRRRGITIALALVAVAAAAWAALASPLLAVDEVRVVGGKHTTAADVARAAGLGSDDNLLLLSTARVEERAETLPWVLEATADRILPGTVRVRVTERTPAMIVSIGAAQWTVDAQGKVLQAGAASDDLPVLGGAETGDIEVGGTLATPEVRDALAAFRSMSKKLQRRIVAVVAPSFERISFSLEDGTLIRFGAAEKLRAKNQVLDALLAELRDRNESASYIDVRVPTSPAVAPRGGGAVPTPSPGA